MHGDLHCDNVLVDAAGDIRVADLGLCLIASGIPGETNTLAAGRTHFLAPEIEKNKNRRTFQTDVYAAAMTCLSVRYSFSMCSPMHLYSSGVSRGFC